MLRAVSFGRSEALRGQALRGKDKPPRATSASLLPRDQRVTYKRATSARDHVSMHVLPAGAPDSPVSQGAPYGVNDLFFRFWMAFGCNTHRLDNQLGCARIPSAA